MTIEKMIFLNKNNREGFTLVELLVVLAIIGILILMAVAILSNAKAKARDSQRVSDIKVLHQALAMYLNNHDRYLTAGVALPGVAITGSDVLSQALRNEKILEAAIIDPRAGQDGGFAYNLNYYYYSVDGTSYTITYCLETTSVSGKNQGCGNSETF